MSYLNRVTDEESAKAFLASLHSHGLLFHPDDSAFDCLAHHGLAQWSLAQIDRNMRRTHAFLPCPSEFSLLLINGNEEWKEESR